MDKTKKTRMDRLKKSNSDSIEFNVCFIQKPSISFKELGPEFFKDFDLVYSITQKNDGEQKAVIYHIYHMEKFYNVYVQPMDMQTFKNNYFGILSNMKKANKQ